jgi:hypothetical protein
MPRFNVGASITISLSKEVVAANAKEAEEIALSLEIPVLCMQCGGPQDVDTWDVTDLDGTPDVVEVYD